MRILTHIYGYGKYYLLTFPSLPPRSKKLLVTKLLVMVSTEMSPTRAKHITAGTRLYQGYERTRSWPGRRVRSFPSGRDDFCQ